MKVVILAGGFGTRLSEYTDTIPNPCLRGTSVSLFDISKPENNYIILESFLADGPQPPLGAQPQQSQAWQKNLHVINFGDN